jgi:hypothetical protein
MHVFGARVRRRGEADLAVELGERTRDHRVQVVA